MRRSILVHAGERGRLPIPGRLPGRLPELPIMIRRNEPIRTPSCKPWRLCLSTVLRVRLSEDYPSLPNFDRNNSTRQIDPALRTSLWPVSRKRLTSCNSLDISADGPSDRDGEWAGHPHRPLADHYGIAQADALTEPIPPAGCCHVGIAHDDDRPAPSLASAPDGSLLGQVRKWLCRSRA